MFRYQQSICRTRVVKTLSAANGQVWSYARVYTWKWTTTSLSYILYILFCPVSLYSSCTAIQHTTILKCICFESLHRPKKHIRLKWRPVEVWLTECTWVVHNLGEPATNTHRRDFTSNCTTLLGVSSPNSNVLVILCPFLSILSLRNSQFLWHILPFINQWAKIMIVNSLPCG